MIELVNPDLWVTRGYMIRELYYSKHHGHAISYKYIIYNIDCLCEASIDFAKSSNCVKIQPHYNFLCTHTLNEAIVLIFVNNF